MTLRSVMCIYLVLVICIDDGLATVHQNVRDLFEDRLDPRQFDSSQECNGTYSQIWRQDGIHDYEVISTRYFRLGSNIW